jgi:dTDP-4-dehydrorhamnose 3,5-epimerase
VQIEEVRDLPLAGAKLVVYRRFLDDRGYFTETYRRTDFDKLAPVLGLKSFEPAQINESRSAAGVVRGLHFQYDPPQGKLVRLLYGRGADLSLDVRRGSPTYGGMLMVDMTLDPKSGLGQWIWLPPGLAHGNFYLEDSAIEYICDAPYNPAGEAGLNPLDPGFDLGLCREDLRESFLKLAARGPIVSPRDLQGLSWADWQKDPRAPLIV